jgi:tetratricopeptide (TPR) repeat protein
MEYTQKIVAELPIEQSFGAALELTESALQKQDMKTATELLNKILAAFGEKTPPNVQESAWNSTKAWAYNILAAEIYKTKDYPKAAESFEKAVKYNPKLADAYYLLGRCKWQTKEIDSAISNIAKYIVLGGTSYGARPQQDLETLYKPTHNGTLDGLDQVLAKAKADLGIQ